MNSQQLYQISNSVWGHFVSLDLRQRSDDGLGGRTGLQFYVQVAMGEEGQSVLLGVNQAIASQLAADMFACQASDLAADDVADALGEVTNMLASQVEGFLGMKEDVGLPEHISGQQIETYWHGATVDTEAFVLADGSPVYVAVIDNDRLHVQ